MQLFRIAERTTTTFSASQLKDMNKIIPCFLTLFTMLFLSACKYDSAAPIRNIRFDPKLLGRMQADVPAACTNHFFFDQKTKSNLGAISSSYVLVAFDANLNYAGRQQVMERFGFVEGIAAQASSGSAMLYTLKLIGGLNCQQASQAIKELAKDASVQYAAPYFVKFVNGKEQLTGISNELLVKAKDATAFKNLSENYHAAAITALDEQTFQVAVDKNSMGNALEAANHLQNQNSIEMATPEFIIFEPGSVVSNK